MFLLREGEKMTREEIIIKKTEIEGKLSGIPNIPENFEQRKNLKRLLNRYQVLTIQTSPRKDNIEREKQIDSAVLRLLAKELGHERFVELFEAVRNGSKEDFAKITIFTDEERASMYNDNTEIESKSAKKLKDIEEITNQYSELLDINELRYLFKKIKAKATTDTILTADLIAYRK